MYVIPARMLQLMGWVVLPVLSMTDKTAYTIRWRMER
jgi:hypothetical protein